MDNNIRINQYDSMSSTGPETLSPGSPALPSMQFTSPMPRPMCDAGGTGAAPPATANHSPAYVDNSPATGLDIANSQIAPSPDALAADVVTQDPIVAAYNPYTAEQLAVIESIAMEASSMFCIGATFTSSGELRDSVRKFAHKKGFSVTSSGTRFSCSRCAAAPSYIARRLKKQQQIPPGKRRKRNTTRVGCSFQISYTHFNRNEKRADQPIRINASTCYHHSNGCFPSSSQLAIEKRKAGAITAAVNESTSKSILAVMATGQRIPVEMLRRLVRPLYPPGTSLDSQLLFNIRLKIKRMLAKGDIDLTSHTVTEEDEAHLLSNTEDLDYKQSPDFLTEAFLQFRELLQESLGDQNDVQRMIHYLDKMVKCDPTFDYRIGRSADGTVTGFVWQTGVMRRDFELYGDVLFVDCMGKSINTKGWPINTIAMLDGEKKVCLPCEALIINETIDGYVWVINCILSMAPERKRRDIKFLVGDGIFAAETILTKLGIEGTCRVLLDHHHLLSLEIGSWPKAFGLNLFSLLKEDLTLMVKSPSATAYEQALEGVRSKLHNHPDQKHAQYLETHINSKRHLFANHIVQSLPGHLNIQGNAPAEANHASIVARVGSLVMEPVLLLESLMERHLSICSERNHCISLRHVQCQALAVQSTDRSTIEALKGLSSWGFKLYEKAIRHSQKLHHRTNLDGTHQFDYIDGSSTLTIEASTDVCSCPVWVATGGTTQCSHLLLLQGGFCKEKWAVRWHQRTALGKSPRMSEPSAEKPLGPDHPPEEDNGMSPEEDDDASMRYCGYGDDDVSVGEEEVSVGERACGVVGEEASHREDAATSQEVTVLSRAGTVSYRGAQSGKYDLRELYHIFQDLANCIHKVRDNTTKDLLVGTALKLKDVAVGNVEQVYSQPILDTLHSYLHLFGRTMAPQDMFAQVSRGISHREEDRENQYEPEATATLKRSKPPGANGGRRYRSRNERTMDQMKESSKRAALCSICLQPGHRIVQCSKISEARATLIGHNHVAEFAAGLGDPMLCLVEEPFGSMRETIKKWMQSGRNIPVEAVHVVVRRCFYSATRQDSSRNVVEVFVWGKGGTPVKEHRPAYYPVNKVVQWILANCTARRRKKHILSCLQKPDQEISQHLYDYGTSP